MKNLKKYDKIVNERRKMSNNWKKAGDFLYRAVIIHSKSLYVSHIKEMISELHPDVTVSYTLMYSAIAIEDALKLRPDIIITDFPTTPEISAIWVKKLNTAPFPVHLIFYAESRKASTFL